MTTATSGLSDQHADQPRRPWWRRLRRRQILGAALAAVTVASVTTFVVGGDTQQAAAAAGSTPPPQTNTLCDVDFPARDGDGHGLPSELDWTDTALVPIDLYTIAPAPGQPGAYVETGPFDGDLTYSVVLDNTGDPFDPDISNHPSFHDMKGHTPVVVAGRATVTGDAAGPEMTIELPRGCRYVISIRATGSDGVEYDATGGVVRIEEAAYWTTDGRTPADEDLTTRIGMYPNDQLPLAQIVVQAFHDYAQTNLQFDIGEPGLEGFDVILEDGGERTVDYWGNPICTNYVLDPVTDWPVFDPVTGEPVIDAADPGGNCLTGPDGVVTIKYIPAGLYAIIVVPPDGSDWVQTTTIEGTHAIDVWIIEGDQGLGGEFIGDANAATFQAVGFVSATEKPNEGQPGVVYHYPYTPDPAGGDIVGCLYNGQMFPPAVVIPQNGIENLDGTVEPVTNAYVALNDVGVHDTQMALVQTDANGCFRFEDVPQGSYMLAAFDYELLYIMGFYNVTVDATTVQPGTPDAPDTGFVNGVVDMGDQFLLRWFGWASGHVFYDNGIAKNGTPIDDPATPGPDTKDGSPSPAGNGVRDCIGQNDPGFDYDTVDPALCEAGIPNWPVNVRNRDGAVVKATFTDADGYYEIATIWTPLFQWQVVEVGAGALDTTGLSVHDAFDRNAVHSQAQCPPGVATLLEVGGTAIDENCLPAELGGGLLAASIYQANLNNVIDFGKVSYLDPAAPNGFLNGGTGNGGIQGAVMASVTRAEWAGQLQAAEDNEPGIPNVKISIWEPDPACTLVDPVTGATGEDNPDCYTVPGPDQDPDTPGVQNWIRTDEWQGPGLDRNGQTCTVPMRDGSPYKLVNPTWGPLGDQCTGSWIIGPHTKDGAFDGGYAFGDLPAGHYVIDVELPPGWQIVKEDDLNTDEGNSYVPAVPPAGCAGEYHYAQVPEVYASPYDAFDAAGNYNGAPPVRLCDRRLVRVQPFRNAGVDIFAMPTGTDTTFTSNAIDGAGNLITNPVEPSAVAPDQVWLSTEAVPLPGRMYGLVLNDLVMTANTNSFNFGEQEGVANVPIGIYDFTGQLITTVWTDENGNYEVLLPSGYSINRASPGGAGPKMYRVVINDPGPDPANPNWGYDPAYITNPNVLDIWPGTFTKADTPLLSLGSNGRCSLPTGTPQLFVASDVYGTSGSLPTDYTLTGVNLSDPATGGPAQVTLAPMSADGTVDRAAAITVDPARVTLTQHVSPLDGVSVYDELHVDLAGVEADVVAAGGDPLVGPYQVGIDNGTALSGSPRNMITFHALGAGYDLQVWTVPARATDPDPDHVIQNTIEAAHADPDPRGDLIVVPPDTYRESVVLHDRMVLQGFGPGGLLGVTPELGQVGLVETPFNIIQGSVIAPQTVFLDPRIQGSWNALVDGLRGTDPWTGNQTVQPGPAVTLLMDAADAAGTNPLQIDGLGITASRAHHGAVFANADADGLVISNNLFQANNAKQGGAAISLGVHTTNYDGDGDGLTIPFDFDGGEPASGRSENSNDNVIIRDNRLLQNGGTTLAGAIGIFNGADGYKVLDNEFCGNYAAEYGGALSHFGYSTGARIAGNVFENNESFTEGGALLLGGESGVPAGGSIGEGSGAVTIDSNRFLYNLAGDDGGAIMALHPLDSTVKITNNVIADNVSADTGGGIHLFDASNVTVSHNTFVNNTSTSSAPDAGGFVCTVNGGPATCPKAGGLTSQPHSGVATPLDPSDDWWLDPGRQGDTVSNFSNPTLENNIFWHNQAGSVEQVNTQAAGPQIEGTVVTIVGYEDLGVYDGTVATGDTFSPKNSVLSVAYAGDDGSNVVGVDPQFVADLPLQFRARPLAIQAFLGQIEMIFPGVAPIEVADYHLASAFSPAADLGLLGDIANDIDGDARPTTLLNPIGDNTLPDAGADEIGAGQIFGLLYFSTVGNQNAPIQWRDEDIVAWTGTELKLALDGDVAGNLPGEDVDAVHVFAPDDMLMSFLNNGGLGNPGIELQQPDGTTITVFDEDVVRYTAGVWSVLLDGSTFGLNSNAQDIDAISALPDGTYLVSFTGLALVPGQSGNWAFPDEDVARLVPTLVDPVTGQILEGYFEPYLSGSILGLNGSGAGDVDGVAVLGAGTPDPILLLSTKGTVTIGDITARDEDVIACGGIVFAPDGTIASCDVGDAVFWDGSANGVAARNDINALSGPLAG